MREKDFRRKFDPLWKIALRRRPKEVLKVFWREMHDLIDWSYSPQDIDKEFFSKNPNDQLKGQVVDSLIKFRLLPKKDAKKEEFLILHTEFQAQKDKNILLRMSLYLKSLSASYPHCAVRQMLVLFTKDLKYRPCSYRSDEFLLYSVKNFIKTIRIFDYYGVLTYDDVHMEEKNIVYFLILLVLDSMNININNSRGILDAKKKFLKAMERCGHSEEDIKLAVWASSIVLYLKDKSLFEEWEKEVKMQKQFGSISAEYFVNEDCWSFKKGKLQGEQRGLQKGEQQGLKKGEQRGRQLRNLELVRKLMSEGYLEDQALTIIGVSPLEYQQILLLEQKQVG